MNQIIRTAGPFVCIVMLAAVCLHTVPAFAGTLLAQTKVTYGRIPV